jgi:hypothetical protein
MSVAPNLPTNVLNRIIRDAAILEGKNSFPKFIFSNAKQRYIFRARFRKRYLKRFINLERLLRFRLLNPPEFTMILPSTVATYPEEQRLAFLNESQTDEERNNTLSRMKSAMIIKFPQKIIRCLDGDDDKSESDSESESEWRGVISGEINKYSYCDFDNGYIFIKQVQDLDNADECFPMFYRGYICLDGRIYPIFDKPEADYYCFTKNKFESLTEVRYLEKELGMFVHIPKASYKYFEFYNEENHKWSSGSFTREEARFLIPFYEEPEQEQEQEQEQ